MKLILHDTMTREKRPFEPRDPGRVTLYVCGPTVYDYAHIGNARPAVVFDVLFRVLRQIYGEAQVVYARNVTDVDDKINAKAAHEGVAIREITARYEAIYLQDMAQLSVLAPTLTPHVTENMEAIRNQIAALVDRGSAYAAEGHVLFDVSSFKDYGALSGRNLDDMIAGARVEVAPYKRNPHDFVLWKPSKPGEPQWPSPWGEGRPGWHIECSAMIEAVLGLPIDIHGGGHDLIFPHHENEIAQGRCAHGDDVYSRYWVHNGFLTMDAEKMSKSLGNVLLLNELVKSFPGEVVRLALLSAHYRAPLDWTDQLLESTVATIERWRGAGDDAAELFVATTEPLEFLSRLREIRRDMESRVFSDQIPSEGVGWVKGLLEDLNTPVMIQSIDSILNGVKRERNTAVHGQTKPEASAELALSMIAFADFGMGFILGIENFLIKHIEEKIHGITQNTLQDPRIEIIVDLISQRDEARRSKDWGEADRIRGELDALNVVVMDGPAGAVWRFKEPG